MEKLLDLLKGAAPALATAVAGPMGGLAVKAIAEKLGVPATVDAVTASLTANPEQALLNLLTALSRYGLIVDTTTP